MTRTQSYFRMEKFALRICGISFREHENLVYKIVGNILLFNICLYAFLAAGDFFKHDFEMVADLLTYQFSIVIAVIKALTVLLNREKIGKLLNKVDTGLRVANFPSGYGDEEQLMKKCVLITTVQTSLYWMCGCFCYVFAVAYTLAVRIRSSDYHDWQFPFGAFTILNVTYSPNFEISLFYQCWNCAGAAVLFTTIDLLIAAVLCHVCYNLKILQAYLRRMVDYANEKMENGNTPDTSTLLETANYNNTGTVAWNNLNAHLKLAVEYHLAIINITKEVDESFSALLLLIFLGTLGVLSLLIFKVSLIPLTDVRMLRSSAELTVAIIQVLMVCFWSEQMLFEGQEVGAAVYEASYVGTDLRFQKSLVLIMRRSQTPIRLTAGFVEVSLSTFTWILRSTYSAYMVLRKHNLRDD